MSIAYYRSPFNYHKSNREGEGGLPDSRGCFKSPAKNRTSDKVLICLGIFISEYRGDKETS